LVWMGKLDWGRALPSAHRRRRDRSQSCHR
jgi:hypothetical protein